MEKRHSVELKAFNDKFISISGSNERLMAHIASFSTLESEVIELRRALKQSRSTNLGLDHLWEIK